MGVCDSALYDLQFSFADEIAELGAAQRHTVRVCFKGHDSKPFA
jgi:hypothetical protein